MSMDKTAAEKPVKVHPVDEALALRFKHTKENPDGTPQKRAKTHGAHRGHNVAPVFPQEQPGKRHSGVKVQGSK